MPAATSDAPAGRAKRPVQGSGLFDPPVASKVQPQVARCSPRCSATAPLRRTPEKKRLRSPSKPAARARRQESACATLRSPCTQGGRLLGGGPLQRLQKKIRALSGRGGHHPLAHKKIRAFQCRGGHFFWLFPGPATAQAQPIKPNWPAPCSPVLHRAAAGGVPGGRLGCRRGRCVRGGVAAPASGRRLRPCCCRSSPAKASDRDPKRS